MTMLVDGSGREGRGGVSPSDGSAELAFAESLTPLSASASLPVPSSAFSSEVPLSAGSPELILILLPGSGTEETPGKYSTHRLIPLLLSGFGDEPRSASLACGSASEVPASEGRSDSLSDLESKAG